jgi:DGQHR domain-containing protein
MLEIELPDPSYAEGVPLFGNVISATEFQGAMPYGLFKQRVPDPRKLEGAGVKYNTELAEIASLRTHVNRLVTGAKKKNVVSYARYIVRMVKTGEGFTPQIVIWSQEKLEVVSDKKTGLGYIQLPHHIRFVALDGDTQTAARALAEQNNPNLFDKQVVKVTVVHGVPQDDAAQIFADCNANGTKVTTSMAIGLDSRDDATQLAKYVEKNVPALTDKVNRQKRQLAGGDSSLITISALRASVVCFVQGIGGIQNQTKAVEIEDDDLDLLHAAATKWYQAVTDVMNTALQPDARAGNFAASPSVWCAIGAIGHDILVKLVGTDFKQPATPDAISNAFKAQAEAKFGKVDWERNAAWLAHGAKQSAKSGAISLGGPKETGSLVYKALKDGDLNTQTPSAAAA